MKKIFLAIGMIMLVNFVVAQASLDTVLKRADTILKNAAIVNKKVDSLAVNANRIKDSINKLIGLPASPADCQKCNMDGIVKGFPEWVLVFLPAVIFIVLFIIILAKGLNKFDLQGALAENDYTNITVPNKEYTAANLSTLGAISPSPDIASILPPTIEVSNTVAGSASNFRPSISRYIAFVTSILTLIVALCMSCFFIYHYIRTGCAPDLSALSIILIALGLGVAPYAFNKVSTAINKNKPE